MSIGRPQSGAARRDSGARSFEQEWMYGFGYLWVFGKSIVEVSSDEQDRHGLSFEDAALHTRADHFVASMARGERAVVTNT